MAAADVAAVPDEVVAEPLVVEHLQPPEPQHQLERRQQTRAVVVADAALLVAAMPSPRFADRQLSPGFRSSHGQQPSTITTRPMR